MLFYYSLACVETVAQNQHWSKVCERVHGQLRAFQLRLQVAQLEVAALALAAAHQRQRAQPREPLQLCGARSTSPMPPPLRMPWLSVVTMHMMSESQLRSRSSPPTLTKRPRVHCDLSPYLFAGSSVHVSMS
ncbi:hypothetical protein MSG28_011569 [Choristoneura fumiferana]|uniref:Uncharacterized protein n=1 Tax=Choristoneura fumiferana TaxID=7141 RepID=A0ACC0JNP9_CHOFU|nr:hypothetical protein MSG28_011569 [Choristoneura fumiferana]